MQDTHIHALLVEDNAGDARLVREMLAEAGGGKVELTHASTLSEALERLDETPFDLILLDLGLPESSGLDTFTRTHEAHAEIPIVVLSGLDDEQVAIRAVQEGAQDYLAKRHLSGGALLRAMRYAIERHGARERELSQMRRGGESGAIAFVGAKGGVGTSTFALNFASVLATEGRSTIAVELRGSFGSFSSMLGRTPPENLSHLTALDASQITSGTVGSRLSKTPFGLNVLFGPQEAREETSIAPEQAAAVVDAVAELSDIAVLDVADYASDAAREAMRRAWRVFLVCGPEVASMRAAGVALDSLRTAGVTGQLMGVVLVNRVALPLAPNLDEINERLGVQVLGAVPPAAEACAAAQKMGTPVVLAQPENVFSDSLRDITERLVAEQITPQTVW